MNEKDVRNVHHPMARRFAVAGDSPENQSCELNA